MVIERADVTNVCDYSRCTNGLVTAGTRRGRYRTSSSAKKVSDNQEVRECCCAALGSASEDFAEPA